MTEMLLVSLVLVFGAILQSVIGFGLGLLCAPIVYFIMPELVPGPMIMNALLLTTILAISNRGEIDYRQTGVSILGGGAGVLLAGSVLLFIDAHQYQLLFGVSILIAVLLSMIGFSPKVSVVSSLIAALVSGFMGTTTSAGGAPMGLLYQNQAHRKIKANLSIFFVFINLFGIIVLWFTGAVGKAEFLLFLGCIPALLIGWFAAQFINRSVNERIVRQLILAIAALSGLILILFDA